MTAADAATTPAAGVVTRPPRRRVWVRPAASAEDRRRVLRALFPSGTERWWVRFGLMMALSVVIAVMGLSADSAALVIGAMLIAPLMTPVLGLAAALVVALGRHAARAAATVIVGSGAAIGLAWGISLILPSSERTLTHEVLARTSPDLRDLLVALAAGAAGAYATVRDDVSAALPGVAVAVALVPPLATVGYTLAADRSDLAGGALLLFAANLLAIVFAGVVVFLVTGLAPARRLAQRSRWVMAASAAVVLALLLVAVPLVHQSATAIRHANRLRQINSAVASWLTPTGLTLTNVAVSGEQVAVDVTGSQAPPDTEPLRQTLVTILGSGAAVRVRWFQNGSSPPPKPSPSPTTTIVADQATLRSVVNAWLGASGSGAGGFVIQRITTTDSHVTVEIAGPVAPPPAADLAQRLTARLGHAEQVNVTWSDTSTLTRVRTAIQPWLTAHPDIEVLGVAVTGLTATIDLAGAQAPNPTGLIAAARAATGLTDIEVRFAPLQRLTPTSSTTVVP